jgi:hypothetical protein
LHRGEEEAVETQSVTAADRQSDTSHDDRNGRRSDERNGENVVRDGIQEPHRRCGASKQRELMSSQAPDEAVRPVDVRRNAHPQSLRTIAALSHNAAASSL